MVSAISSTGLEFSSTHMMEQGASLRLTLELPDSEGGALTDLPVRISQVYAFGDDVAYLGEFESMDKGLKARLDELAKRLNQRKTGFSPTYRWTTAQYRSIFPETGPQGAGFFYCSCLAISFKWEGEAAAAWRLYSMVWTNSLRKIL